MNGDDRRQLRKLLDDFQRKVEILAAGGLSAPGLLRYAERHLERFFDAQVQKIQ